MTITTLPLDKLLSSSTEIGEPSAKRQLYEVSRAVAKARKVIVVSGAGISCSSGIPDFRSADGLYSLVKARYPTAFVTGRDLFSSGLFQNPTTTSLFYTFIAELSLACRKAQPTRTHHFIHRLETKGKLLRSYTQNVDGLERRIGLESGGRGKGLKKKGTRNVELHGDLGRVRCVLCFADFAAREDWIEMFREGEAPGCPACEARCASRMSRAARATPIGSLRPSIVLYDEPHPLGDDIGGLQSYDLSRSPDMLLIMGTSLKVHGLKKLVKEFAKAVHAKKGLVVFVNATPPSKEWEGVIDYHVHGETDRWVEKVEEEWRKIKPQDWEVQTLLDGEMVPVAGGSVKGKSKQTDEAETPYQLPTPRPSQSPSKSSVLSLGSPLTSIASSSSSPQRTPRPIADSSTFYLSPQESDIMRPNTPLSPSKRRANMPTPATDNGSLSPTKKIKSKDALLPPATGLPSTPGHGNLFPSPTKQVLTLGEEWEDAAETPKLKAKPLARGRTMAAVGKENSPSRALVKIKSRRVAGTVRTRATVAASTTR